MPTRRSLTRLAAVAALVMAVLLVAGGRAPVPAGTEPIVAGAGELVRLPDHGGAVRVAGYNPVPCGSRPVCPRPAPGDLGCRVSSPTGDARLDADVPFLWGVPAMDDRELDVLLVVDRYPPRSALRCDGPLAGQAAPLYLFPVPPVGLRERHGGAAGLTLAALGLLLLPLGAVRWPARARV